MTAVGTDRRSAVFLDRDGVLNRNRHDYVKSWEEFEFLPSVFAGLRLLADSDFAIVIVTNQSVVGRRIISETQLDRIHSIMTDEIERQGGRVDAVLCCPHHPEDHCKCRKPHPGLLLRAANELNLDLSRSFLIGDARSDTVAALRAGCQAIMVLTGRGSIEFANAPPHLVKQCHVARDLAAAITWILAKDHTQLVLTTEDDC